MRWLIVSLAAIPVMAVWATLVFLGTANGWWRQALAPPGDTAAFVAAVQRELDDHATGNAAFRLLEGGAVAGEHFVSIGDPVLADTQFQAASVSKWLTAWAIMTLVQRGRVDLDAPVAGYLSRWQLPTGDFDADQVTIRRLLSHTAGLTDDLGYQGFAPGTATQSLEDSLTQAVDARPGADGRVRVGMEPGSDWRYSGGGYALLQLVIEEVTGLGFEPYMQEAVLTPLGLSRSTFRLSADDTGNLATFYDANGEPGPPHAFSAPSAAGLYTTAADMTRFLQAHLPGPAGEPPGRGVLAPQTLDLMHEPNATVMGTDIWGLGLILYAPNGEGGYVVGHDGGNYPAINATVRLDPATGDGIVLLATGDPALAGRLGGEWVFWLTGRLDVPSYYRAIGDVIVLVAIGWGVIAIGVLLIGWGTTRKSNGKAAWSEG
jgi:CubicO group peptidase (beta-lactamase class C family)